MSVDIKKENIFLNFKMRYGWLLIFLLIGSFYVKPKTIINLDEDSLLNNFIEDLSSIVPNKNNGTTTLAKKSGEQNINFDSEKGINKNYFLRNIYDIRNDFLMAGSDLVEVNLVDKKIRIYKKGQLEKEVTAIKRGNKNNWGGTPEGIYKIGNKIRIAFSNAAEAYMPFALQIYGKFYIHGIPYYPNGEIIQSYFSGGCVQMKDSDAEAVFKIVEINDPVIVIDTPKDDFKYLVEAPKNSPAVNAPSFLVADLDSNFVFISKNPENQYPIASITKLMSSIVVTENITLDRYVYINDQQLLETYGQTNGLEVGNKFRLYELLYPLLTESSNDAASLIGEYMGQEKTVQMMNDKARAIMMEKTVFKDTSGFDFNNVSTAKDLFYLGKYTKNITPLLLDISRGEKVKIYGKLDFDFAKMKNKNIFWQEDNFIGGKTGYLDEAKNTGIFIFDMKLDKNKLKNYLRGKELVNVPVYDIQSTSTTSTKASSTIDSLKLPDSRNVAIVILGSKNPKIDVWALKSWLAQNYFLVDKVK